MTELQGLSLRDKELVLQFKEELRRQGKQVFSCDDLREFVKTLNPEVIERLTDSHGRLNLGGKIKLMLDAENPNHQIRWVVTDMGRYNRRVGLYEFVNP